MLLPTSGKVEISGYDIYKEEQQIREKINFICVIEFFHLILISKNIITVHHGIYITGMLR